MEKRKPEERKPFDEAMRGMRSFFFYMLADFAIIAGLVLILFGIGDFISSLLGIAGAGKVLLGILLFIAGSAVLARTRANIKIGLQQMPQQPPQEPEAPPPETPTGIYR